MNAITPQQAEQLGRQAVKNLTRLDVARLVEMFEETDAQGDQARKRGDVEGQMAIAEVRGWLMDALEAKNPAALEWWLESLMAEDSPRLFFLHADGGSKVCVHFETNAYGETWGAFGDGAGWAFEHGSRMLLAHYTETQQRRISLRMKRAWDHAFAAACDKT